MTLRKIRVLFLRLGSLPVILMAIFVRPEWEHEETTSFIIEMVGYLFLIFGLCIRVWAILYIGGKKSKELTTTGPYSLCRHPLYLGTFSIVVGAGLCFENIPMLLATILIMVPIHLVVARMEDEHMAELFPQTYPEYKKLVRGYWPNFKNYRSSETIEIPIRSIRRVLVDTIAVLMIPQIEDLLELLQENCHMPILWTYHMPF
ncbi:MAG TPA: isoprenylcysteine carboxylmethyltransferase family protein [Phycisphaerae bacterium]|nr:isoprenylcysteine carboxylmethyltransferase family protein [Phycisphaerae bacterium]